MTAGAVRQVLDLALARPARLAGARLVCVDGPAGSGKTSFAAGLDREATSRGLRVAVVHMDDVYEGWGGLAQAGARVHDQIVRPLAQEVPGSYQRYDWHQGRWGGSVTVPVADLLVLEGVGSADPAYQEHLTLLVWVWAPVDLRLARGLARDGDEVAEHWRRWMRDEELLHARDRTRARADVEVDGRSGALSRGPAADAGDRR